MALSCVQVLFSLLILDIGFLRTLERNESMSMKVLHKL